LLYNKKLQRVVRRLLERLRKLMNSLVPRH
jgi:hypothetical protein